MGDLGSIPGLGRSPGEGNGYPLQYSGLENSMDCVVPGVTESWTQLSDLNLLSPSVDRGSVTFAASASTAPQTCLLRLNLTNCDYSAGTKNCVSGNSFQVLYFFCHLPISPPSFPHLFFFLKKSILFDLPVGSGQVH